MRNYTYCCYHHTCSYLWLDLGYNKLAVAVLNRSLCDLQQLTSQDVIPDCASNGKLTILELAIGWPEGLSFLVALDKYCPISAIKAACSVQDTVSLAILLQAKVALFSTEKAACSRSYHMGTGLWILQCALESSALAVVRAVASEFARRRSILHELAVQHLSITEKKRFGLSTTGVLGKEPHSVYEALAVRVHIPAWLDCCRMASAYIYPSWYYRRLDLEFLSIFYNAGFHFIDSPIPSNFEHKPKPTPLHHLIAACVARPEAPPPKNPSDCVYGFFLRHGANPVFNTGRYPLCWPSVLFYLAALMPLPDSTEPEAVEPSVRSSFNQIHALTDSCDCFCSTNGCIAPAMFWRGMFSAFNRSGHHVSRHQNRGWMLERFCQLCNLDDVQMSAILAHICRIELFERLGMAHTCCELKGWEVGPSEEERAAERRRLQEEDSELAGHLDVILEEYVAGYKQYEGQAKGFWSLWWQVVDLILPPLTPEEACLPVIDEICCDPETGSSRWQFIKPTDTVLAERDQRERKALIVSGFDPDTPFADIISIHFEKYRSVFPGGRWPDDVETGALGGMAGHRQHSHLFPGGDAASLYPRYDQITYDTGARTLFCKKREGRLMVIF